MILFSDYFWEECLTLLRVQSLRKTKMRRTAILEKRARAPVRTAAHSSLGRCSGAVLNQHVACVLLHHSPALVTPCSCFSCYGPSICVRY